MDPTSIRFAGAVPLDGLGATPAAAAGPSQWVIDVTEDSFEADVLARSDSLPVVIDFWASWCGPCKQLSPILEKLAAEGAGQWLLAKIDVDANPQIAQAAQVQGIPAVKAVVAGQMVAEFTGALPESQVRQWIGQLVTAARAGQFGELRPPGDAGDTPAAEVEAPVDPDLEAGDDALMAGDTAAASAAYQRLHDRVGVSAELRTEARAGIARAALMGRADTLDPEQLQKRLVADPHDVGAVTGLADLLVLNQRVDDAFALLLRLVRDTAGDERDVARTHLLELFALIGDADPAVGKARRDLASALF